MLIDPKSVMEHNLLVGGRRTEEGLRGPEQVRMALDAEGESAEKFIRQKRRPCISRVSMRARGQIVCANST